MPAPQGRVRHRVREPTRQTRQRIRGICFRVFDISNTPRRTRPIKGSSSRPHNYEAWGNNAHKGHKIILKHNFWSTRQGREGRGASAIKHLYLILDNHKNHRNDMSTIAIKTTMERTYERNYGNWKMLRAVSSGKHCFKLSEKCSNGKEREEREMQRKQ